MQILFAFLLTVPFSMRFGDLTPFQRDVYYVTLIGTALSTACLIAPSAAHRMRFHQSERAWIVESANQLTIAGLVFLAVALSGAVLLVTDIMFDGAPRVDLQRRRAGRDRRASGSCGPLAAPRARQELRAVAGLAGNRHPAGRLAAWAAARRPREDARA